MLSSTVIQRPHGWNRATGQWKHYRCIDRHKLFTRGQLSSHSNNITYHMRKEVISIDINKDNIIILKVMDNNDNEEYIKCNKLIITVPAYEALRLIDTIPNSININDDIIQVLERSSKNYLKTLCKTIYIDKNTDIGLLIFDKFHIENIYEFDARNIGEGSITLVSLGYTDDDDTITLHLHAKSEEHLNIKYITSWIISYWLLLDYTAEAFDIIDEDDIKCFYQFKTSFTPLTPLKEMGCIEVNDNIILAGDYTVGSSTFSGATLAAYKTSKVLAKSLS
jgi:hypothetical protein